MEQVEKSKKARSTEEVFIEYLEKRAGDRGMMADLRHGFSGTTEYRAWPHIAPWFDLTNDRKRTIALTVAGGFAVHGKSVHGNNMGDVCHALAVGDGSSEEGLKTFDARFRRLLTCRSHEELCGQLKRIIRAAERKGVTIDFVQLFHDLHYWGERCRLRWARSYWGGSREKGENES